MEYVYQYSIDGQYLTEGGYTTDIAEATKYSDANAAPADHVAVELDVCTLCGGSGHTRATCSWNDKAAEVNAKLFPDRDGAHTVIYTMDNGLMSDFIRVPKEELGSYIERLLPKRGNADDYIVVAKDQLGDEELSRLNNVYAHAILGCGIVLVLDDSSKYEEALNLLK